MDEGSLAQIWSVPVEEPQLLQRGCSTQRFVSAYQRLDRFSFPTAGQCPSEILIAPPLKNGVAASNVSFFSTNGNLLQHASHRFCGNSRHRAFVRLASWPLKSSFR